MVLSIGEAIIIGIIQGIAEWLPISSEGITSLILVKMLGWQFSSAITTSLWLHLGTMFSAIVYFRKDLKNIFSNLPKYCSDKKTSNAANETTRFIITATIISLAIGGALYFLLKKITINGNIAGLFIGLMLMITGFSHRLKKQNTNSRIKKNDGWIVGLLQGLAVIPGISRSGITVFGMIMKDYSVEKALKLSFLLSVPVVAAASIMIMITEPTIINKGSIIALITSFVAGLISIHYFLRLAREINFSNVCFILGILSIVSYAL